MRLALFINDKETDSMRLDFQQDSLFQTKLNLAIGLMKIEKGWKMKDNDWQIFLIHKSKVHETAK